MTSNGNTGCSDCVSVEKLVHENVSLRASIERERANMADIASSFADNTSAMTIRMLTEEMSAKIEFERKRAGMAVAILAGLRETIRGSLNRGESVHANVMSYYESADRFLSFPGAVSGDRSDKSDPLGETFEVL